MGFVEVGYSTRNYKRLKTVKKVQYKHVLRDIQSRSVNRLQKKEIAKPIVAPLAKFCDLPPEVVQNIFVFLGNGTELGSVNRYLHRCLTPNDQLVRSMIRYNFISEQRHSEEDDKDIKVIDVSVFNTPIFTEFISKNFDNIFHDVDKMTSSDEVETEGPIPFPRTFLRNFKYFFDQKDLISSLFIYSKIENPWLQIVSLLNWYFTDLTHYTSSQLFDVIDLIMKGSETPGFKMDSAEPLIALCSELFNNDTALINEISKENGYQNIEKFARDTIEKFITNYYQTDTVKHHLSDPTLWKLLQQTSDIKLIDLIISHGGNPQYDVFF